MPPEILTNILSKLCTFDLLQNVSAVSKQFNELSKSPAVHQRVFISIKVDQDKAANFLKTTTLIRKLEIGYPRNSFSLEFLQNAFLLFARKAIIYGKNLKNNEPLLSLDFYNELVG